MKKCAPFFVFMFMLQIIFISKPGFSLTSEPIDLKEDSSKEKKQPLSRFSVFASGGAGLLWNHYTERYETITYEDGSSAIVGKVIRVSQPKAFFGLGGSFHLIDACQHPSKASCVDVLSHVQIGGSYELERDAVSIIVLAGLKTHIYFGHQRRVALTTTLDVGYEHLFLQSRESQTLIPDKFQLDPAFSNIAIASAGPGILVNLGSSKQMLRYAIAADFRLHFFGGQFGFSVPVELRFRI